MTAGAVAFTALFLYIHVVTAYAGDKVWLLHAAGRLLDGQKLYQDVFEINPPLIYALYVVPVFISRHVRWLADYNALALIGFGMVALSVAVSIRLFRDSSCDAPRCARWRIALLLFTVFVPFTSPLYFCDREHIFLVLVFPYIVRWLPSLAEQKFPYALRFAVGVMAAIGFCIKPHCAVAFAVLQGIRVAHRKSWRVLLCLENLCIYMFAACYLLAMYNLYPAYLHVVMPMAFATYGAIRHMGESMFFFAIAALSLGITLADFRLRHTSPYRRDILYLLAACGAFLAYALSNNGWGYTWNPLLSMILILCGFVLWEFRYLECRAMAEGQDYTAFRQGRRACQLNFAFWAGAALLLAYCGFVETCGNPLDCGSGRQFLSQIDRVNSGRKLQSFGTISIDSDVWAFLSRKTGAAWGTRFNHLWMLPRFFVAGEEFSRRNRWIPEYVGNAYAEDLRRNRPQLVFVDDNDAFFSVHAYVDWVEYLSRIPAFAEEWRHYRYAGKIDRVTGPDKHKAHSGYYVYERMP